MVKANSIYSKFLIFSIFTPFKTFAFTSKNKLGFDMQSAYRKLIQYAIMKKPKLSFWQICNQSFKFSRVQIGFSLQKGNANRILELK